MTGMAKELAEFRASKKAGKGPINANDKISPPHSTSENPDLAVRSTNSRRSTELLEKCDNTLSLEPLRRVGKQGWPSWKTRKLEQAAVDAEITGLRSETADLETLYPGW